MRERFELEARIDLFNENPDKYLITPTNNILTLGNISVEMPVNAYRVPYKPYKVGTEFIQFKTGVFEHGMIYYRLDTIDEEILYQTNLNASHSSTEIKEVEQQYIHEILSCPTSETELFRGSFKLNDGQVHFLKAEQQVSSPYLFRYQALYLVEGNWRGSILFLEHCVRVEGNKFTVKSMESPLIANLSDILFKTLETVKILKRI